MASPPLYRNGGENQSSLLSLSLCTFARLSRICAYITFDPHLCEPWPAPTPSDPTSLRPPTSLYQRVRHLSSNHPRSLCSNPTATLRNFISYASLIIRRSFTRFPPPTRPLLLFSSAPILPRHHPSLFPNPSREDSIFFSLSLSPSFSGKEILIRRMCVR